MFYGRRYVAMSAFALLIGCRGDGGGSPPPGVSFLAATPDSTYWVHTDNERLRVRRSAMLLTVSDSTISELYVIDDDRSFADALLVGQRIYRRDLVAGDSVVLFTDSSLVDAAAEYSRTHPEELPLGPDDDMAESPAVVMTTETDLLSLQGHFLNVEFHVDEESNGISERHSTHRRVYDVRTGSPVLLAALIAGDTTRVIEAGRAQLKAFSDSVNAATDERAVGARAALSGMVFDAESFSIVELDGQPAVQFVVPGMGELAGGYALPLAPLLITRQPWWNAASAALPHEQVRGRRTWRGTYGVVAESDPGGSGTRLQVRRANRRWAVGLFVEEILQVYRLDGLTASTRVAAALQRAFDDAGYYSGEVRTAAHRSGRRCRRTQSRQCEPKPHANQNRRSLTL